MIVCGIDPSLTNTGIAILTHGQPTHLGTEGWPGHNSASDLDRYDRVETLRNKILRHIRTHNPDLIVIERPAYAQNNGSACDRHALWHGLLGMIRHGKYRYAGVSPTGRARFIAGNGHASKQRIVDNVTTWWPHERKLHNDNIADAAGLAAMGAAWAGDPLPFELTRVQRETLEVVAWPVMA